VDDLAVFLNAQFDEDERVASAAPRGPWSVEVSGSVVAADGGRVVPSVGGAVDGCVTCWPEGPVVDHVLAYDPARVLREIEAKRGVLRQYETVRGQVRNPVSAENRRAARIAQGELEDVLRILATVYADRPGYREEWRP
jgi:hypothetical protein